MVNNSGSQFACSQRTAMAQWRSRRDCAMRSPISNGEGATLVRRSSGDNPLHAAELDALAHVADEQRANCSKLHRSQNCITNCISTVARREKDEGEAEGDDSAVAERRQAGVVRGRRSCGKKEYNTRTK
jgi:hypothetical protein